ncbi:MAG: TatD family hydrolase [Clostridia bacterium]|nr:TatD family hydrolase [Clostridia bacterium]
MLFDSHAHYDDEKFDGLRDELLSKMPEYGVGKIVNAGASLKGSYASKDLSHRYDFMYFTAGVHPESAVTDTAIDGWLSEIDALCYDEKCVAIGEIGLDYYWEKETAPIQKECFRAQLELCRAHSLPAVVHDREAHGDSLEIVKEYPDVKGLFHCYSGSVEMMRELLKMGWYISVGGVVTFKNARKTVEVIEALKDIPCGISRLLLETDCPYLAPVPHRGKLNHSALMLNTAEKVAELLGITRAEVEALTYDNAMRFYNIKE